MKLLEPVYAFITAVISTIGYPGIFFLMFLEGTIAPVPAELVMPFAGFLAASGHFDLWLVILAGTLGVVAGNLFSYFMGLKVGLPFLARYGKYFLIHQKDIDWTVKFFQSRGDMAIFICRFIPAVRHVISIPAGMARMNLFRFTLYTAVGAAIYISFLAYAGFLLGENWSVLSKFGDLASVVVIVIVALAVIAYIYYHVKSKN